MKLGTFAVASMTLVLAAGAAFGQADIAREGSGQHRAACDKLELTAVPGTFWSSLTDWTNGEALTAENTAGKVVLIGTWWSTYKTSHSALSTLENLSKKYGKDGLIVVGVHHDQGWDNAKKVMEDSKATFLYAHDASNKMRATLEWDLDPDFFVIDRAGNFRYVDIVSSSVEKAVESSVKETAEQAKGVPAKLADAKAKAMKDADKTTAISSTLKPGAILDVPFQMPEAAEFTAAGWWEANTNVDYSKNVQGSALPVPLKVEQWLTKEPSTKGRVMVLDFWATWCGPCKAAMPMLDEMYKSNKKDLAMIGISDESEKTVSGFLADHKHAYSMGVDTKQTMYKSLEIKGIPLCVVVSSDGIVRWQGNPHDPNFAKAVQKAIDVDPGVKARRKAEAEFLKSGKGG